MRSGAFGLTLTNFLAPLAVAGTMQCSVRKRKIAGSLSHVKKFSWT